MVSSNNIAVSLLSVTVVCAVCFFTRPASALPSPGGKHQFKTIVKKDDVEFASQIKIGQKKLVLNGVGTRSLLWMKFYLGALYLEQPSSNADAILQSDQAKHIIMHFLQGISRETMGAEFRSSFMKNCEVNCNEQVKFVDQLVQKMKDLDVGDQVKITINGSKVQFRGPGEQTGPVEVEANDEQIARTILKIFIASKEKEESLRDGMLGQYKL